MMWVYVGGLVLLVLFPGLLFNLMSRASLTAALWQFYPDIGHWQCRDRWLRRAGRLAGTP